MRRVNSEAYKLAVHALVRQKKFYIAILISLMPLIGGWLLFYDDQWAAESAQDDGYRNHWEPGFSELIGGVVLTVSIPLMSLLLAGGMIADEAEERTLSYLLVRPVARSVLYASRALAVLTIAAPLALLQVLGLWLIRWVSYNIYAHEGTLVEIDRTHFVEATNLMWGMIPVALGVALMATVFYSLLFGFVSLVVTRYHFFVNLGYLGLWEGMVGHVPAGAQIMTITHHMASIMEEADPTVNLVYGVPTSNPLVSVPVVLALSAMIILVSLVVVKYRDFHVTSAAT